MRLTYLHMRHADHGSYMFDADKDSKPGEQLLLPRLVTFMQDARAWVRAQALGLAAPGKGHGDGHGDGAGAAAMPVEAAAVTVTSSASAGSVGEMHFQLHAAHAGGAGDTAALVIR